MPVTIGEFEVMAQPPAPPDDAAATGAATTAAPIDPLDLQAVQRQLLEAALRVAAD